MIFLISIVFSIQLIALQDVPSLGDSPSNADADAWELLEKAISNASEVPDIARDPANFQIAEKADELFLQIAGIYAWGGKIENARAVAAKINWQPKRKDAAESIAQSLVRNGNYEQARTVLGEDGEFSATEANATITQLIADVCKSRDDAARHHTWLIDDKEIAPPIILHLLMGDIDRAVDQLFLEYGRESAKTEHIFVESLALQLMEAGMPDSADQFFGTIFGDHSPLELIRMAIELANRGHAAPAYQIVAMIDDPMNRKVASRYVSTRLLARDSKVRAFDDLDTSLYQELGESPFELRKIIEYADIDSKRGHFAKASHKLNGVYDSLVSMEITGSRHDVSSTLVQSYDLLMFLAHAQARSRDISGAVRTARYIGSEKASMPGYVMMRDIGAISVQGKQQTELLELLADDPLALAFAQCGAAIAQLDFPVEFIWDEDPVKRIEAVIVLNYASMLHTITDVSKRSQASSFIIDLVGEAVPQESAIPPLVGLVTSTSSSEIRQHALSALTKFESSSDDSRKAAAKALNDDSVQVRIAGVTYLVKFRQFDDELFATLTSLLRDGDSTHFCTAAELIGKTGWAGTTLLPDLADAVIAINDPRCSLYAARAVWRVSGNAPLSLSEAALLDTDDPWVCAKAAELLGEIGTPDSLAVVRKAQDHQDAYVRLHVARAIWKITNDPVEPQRILFSILENESLSYYLKTEAQKTLAQLKHD